MAAEADPAAAGPHVQQAPGSRPPGPARWGPAGRAVLGSPGLRLSGRRLLRPRDHSQQGALPGTARTEHAQHLAAGQLQVHPLQRRRVPLIRAMDAEHVAQLDEHLTHRATPPPALPRSREWPGAPSGPVRRLPISACVASQPASASTANSPAPHAASAAHGTTVTSGGRGFATAPAARTLATASRVSSAAIARPATTPRTLASASRTRSSACRPRGPTPWASRSDSSRSSRVAPRSATSNPIAASTADSAVKATSVPSTPRATGASCSR